MTSVRVASLFLCAGCAVAGAAVFSFSFEPPLYTGSAGGNALAGQDGWYVPSTVPASGDGSVVTYVILGNQAPPNSGQQLVALIGPNIRDQHNIDFSSASNWTGTFDIFVHNAGGGGAIADFIVTSTIPTAGYSFRAAANLENSGANWGMLFDVYNSAGAPTGGQDPGPAFHGLLEDKWYQGRVVFDTSSNRILSVSVSDFSQTFSSSPTGWYMFNGAAGPFTGNALRLFGGGANSSSGVAFDNIVLQSGSGSASPVPALGPLSCLLLIIGIVALAYYGMRQSKAPEHAA